METTQATGGSDKVEGQDNVHAQRHHRNRGSHLKRRRKVATRDHLIPCDFASISKARGQNLIPTPPLMHVMKYMVPTVLVLVSLKYQAKTDRVFLENRAPLWCFLAATCIYWLIVGALKQMTTIDDDAEYFQTLSDAALASGVLSATSLVSIFLPYPHSLVPLIMWIPLPVVLACRPILNYAYSLINRGITSGVNKIHAMVVWARGRKLTEEAPNLPV